MMNLTGKQVLSIIAATVSALTLATAQLTDIFGAHVAQSIVSVAALVNMILNAVVVGVTGQGSLVRDVAAMPGVEQIAINANANPTLAQAATDSTQPKIGATTPEVRSVLVETAKGS
jgi:hypothetical protein